MDVCAHLSRAPIRIGDRKKRETGAPSLGARRATFPIVAGGL